MIRKIFLLLLTFVSIQAKCFHIDTTIFNSEFEKKIFLEYIKTKDVDPIDLFTAIVPDKKNQNIKAQLQNYFYTLDEKNISQYKTKKKLKTIYSSVHDEFLKKYNGETFFGDIFSTGQFNCVSASALYSLVLEHYKFNYNIKETPTHVYIIADPQNTSYLIETTLPSSGLFHFDDKFKKSYIEYLSENKLISESEFRTKSVNSLFNEYYIKDESIDLIKLAGLQYYNKGVLYYNSEKYEEALNNFEKAEILYPSDKIKFLKNGAIASLLENENQNSKYSGKNLAKFINNNSQNLSVINHCRDYFDNISNELIMNHPDFNSYNDYFNDFIYYLVDSVDINDIYQSYYSYRGYYYYSGFKYKKALDEFEKAYSINSSNIRTKQFISEIVLKYLVNETNYEACIDSVNIYTDKFNFLKNNTNLTKYLGYCYCQVIGVNFQNDNFQKGYSYLLSFERYIRNFTNFTLNDEYIGYAYGQVAAYYFRKYNYDLAEKYILKGLEISPNSVELNQRLKSIRSSSSSYTSSYYSNNKYKNALARAKENRISTNQNVAKFLLGKWKMDKFKEDNFEVEATGEHAFKINLLKSKNVIFTEKDKHHTGTWIYDESCCNLKMKDSKYGDCFNLIILELTNKKMIGVMYFEDDTSDAIEVVFSSIN